MLWCVCVLCTVPGERLASGGHFAASAFYTPLQVFYISHQEATLPKAMLAVVVVVVVVDVVVYAVVVVVVYVVVVVVVVYAVGCIA